MVVARQTSRDPELFRWSEGGVEGVACDFAPAGGGPPKGQVIV